MKQPKFTIVIPARFGSTRFPGKPLHKIAGVAMIKRVYNIAKQASQSVDHCNVYVATDDERIVDFCLENNMPCIMTPKICTCGTERVKAVLDKLSEQPDFIINLQGDSPLTPANYLIEMMRTVIAKPSIKIATLATQLNWPALDKFRAHKKNSPTSGTTVTFDQQQNALWFSKQIIPMIRDEEKLRENSEYSPVYKHLGVYGYTPEYLKQYCSLPLGIYEQLEGLEQLRLLENGYKVEVIPVRSFGLHDSVSVDTREDAKLVELLLQEKIIISENI